MPNDSIPQSERMKFLRFHAEVIIAIQVIVARTAEKPYLTTTSDQFAEEIAAESLDEGFTITNILKNKILEQFSIK